MYDKTRNYLHPIKKTLKLRVQDIIAVEEGCNAEGIRISAFEVRSFAIAHGYLHEVHVQCPGEFANR